MTSSWASMHDLRASIADSGEANRQMVLLHVDNTLLAMRTENALHHRSGLLSEKDGGQHPGAGELLELRRRLFGGAVPVSGPASCSSQVRSAPQRKATPSGTVSAEALPDYVPREVENDHTAHCEVNEMSILSAFASVCRRPNISSVVTGVALTALVDILELPCSFVSVDGIHTAIEAASETRAEVHDNASHEVLLSRIFSVYVAALNHPAAVMVDGDVHVRALGRMMVLATHTGSSQLLKRSVEKSMRYIVTTLFRRLLYLSADEAAHKAVVEAGVTVLRFISRLISGEVASFDNDGCEMGLAVALRNSEGSASMLSNSGSSDERIFSMEKTIAPIQLEGLTLAQDCLLLLCSSSRPFSAPLLEVLRNQLCRALLIAGVNTTQSIVLAQTLRTVHLVIQRFSEDLVPQIYNFIRVLHINPLEALANELTDVGLGQAGSPVVRGGSPSLVASPTTPIAAPSLGGVSFGRVSAKQLQRKQERREIILDSLAEFCSDPRFCTFCFIHYDLSWRYASLLPQISQVLANHAYPVFPHNPDETATVPWTQRRGAMANGSKVAAQRRQRTAAAAAAAADHRRDRRQQRLSAAGRLLGSSQRTAFDATTSMVSSIALRAIAAGASPSTFEESGAPISPGTTSSLDSELRRLIRHGQGEKDKLNQFAALFKESPTKKGIPFLLEHAIRVPAGTEEESSLRYSTKLILAEPAGGREIGEALYRLSIVLNKRVLGDYIGEQGRNNAEGDAHAEDPTKPATFFSVRFFEEQLAGFIHQFEFHNKPLLEAIREMVYLLCLPGESQKIDRVMEAFAKHWYQHNVTFCGEGTVVKDESINPFHSQSGAFVLSFAIIMLNTDQHSGKVAQQMKREDFIKMNRGIDDGQDVAAAYLGTVYDDVRQHEVVMADMMDRGFANDTTWKLEMRPCVNFVLHALSENVTAEEADVVRTLANMSSHEPGVSTATATTKSVVLHTLNPFLFESTWKRSLLVFDGMFQFAANEVSLSTVATGPTLAQAIEEAQQLLPTEMAALLSSLRGVCILARAANALGLPAVADQCFMGLLKYVVLNDLANAEEEVRTLYRSVPKLLCMREVFALFVDIYRGLGDSWLPMSRLMLDMHLMGLLVVPAHGLAKDQQKPCEAGDRDTGAAGGSGADASFSLPVDLLHVLLQDPGICANVFAPLTAAAAAGKNETELQVSSERSWFSSLFGGNDSSRVSTADLSKLRDAQGRIASCVPSMYQLLAILQRVASDPCAGVQCVGSLSAASSIGEDAAEDSGTGGALVSGRGEDRKGHGQPGGLDEASAYAASYELVFICAVMSAASTPSLLLLEHFTPLANRLSRLLREVDVYLGDTRASDGMRSYWCTIGNRVVCAALQLAETHLRSERGSIVIKQLWACWMRVTSSVFAVVVAKPLASFLYNQVVSVGKTELGAGPEEEGKGEMPPWPFRCEALLLLEPFAAHATAVSDVIVQRQIASFLSNVVQQCRYSVVEDTEAVVSLCLSFSVWQRHGRAAGMSSEVGDSTERGAMTHAHAKCSAGAAAPSLPSETTMAEVLSLCGRNALLKNADKATGEVGAEAGEWCSLWVYVLRSLGALALCSPDSRDGSEAIFCLQRALLDSEAHELPPSAVAAVYKDILIPLTERLCAPKAQVQTGLRWTRVSKTGSCDQNDTALTVSPDASGSPSNSHPLPASSERIGHSEVMGFLTGLLLTSRPHQPSTLVSTEVKCRLLSLVPKVLLRYTAALTTQVDLLVYLWEQALGTLYAVYSAYPIAEDPAGHDTGGGGGGGGSALHEEAMLIQEAVEETVKNMVYVVAATWNEASSSQVDASFGAECMEAAAFWAVIVRLVKPFAFSAPLIDFMVQGGLVQMETGSDAEATRGAVAPAS
ncbi:hypothetical protein JKF63_01812 [Porcisia hertigi]|uniref:SEC7 domain-containing protein n=1 Tax=Porcisia hertigi TaxID=2761500 RepID=A0A836HJN9_9TRYP|nr:hypothetical protein JKF63_01812 [Porcisia hertigi]